MINQPFSHRPLIGRAEVSVLLMKPLSRIYLHNSNSIFNLYPYLIHVRYYGVLCIINSILFLLYIYMAHLKLNDYILFKLTRNLSSPIRVLEQNWNSKNKRLHKQLQLDKTKRTRNIHSLGNRNNIPAWGEGAFLRAPYSWTLFMHAAAKILQDFNERNINFKVSFLCGRRGLN